MINRKQKKQRNTEKKEVVILREYYQFAFAVIHQNISKNIESDVLNTRKSLLADFCKSATHESSRELRDQVAFEFLNNYAEHITKILEERLSSHSVFYWLHLYRRIQPGLITSDDEKKDANTIGLVRTIVETAMYRFGILNNIGDMVLSDQISHSKVIGGYFSKGLTGESDDSIKKIWGLYQSQWVISDFTEDDLRNIYLIEGIAYEYWRVTAQMRALGKGSILKIDSSGYWKEVRTDEIANLIESYDRRINTGLSYLPTAKGLISFGSGETVEHTQYLISVMYNVEQKNLKELMKGVFPKDQEKIIPNFLLGIVNTINYIESHRILDRPFRNKWGFGFEEVVLFLQSISYYVFIRRAPANAKKWLSLFQFLQRGYTYTNNLKENFEKDLNEIIEKLQNMGIKYGQNIQKDLPSILSHFTLTPAKQAQISLWSFGPRPVIFPNGEGAIIDLAGCLIILRNLFFGVKENQTARGTEFENILRAETIRRGYQMLSYRDLRLEDGKHRETDLAIKIGDVLVLCDCRSIEKPVDFDLGKIKTLQYRTQLMQDKLKQIISMREFVTANPKGRNYDFSWAKTIYSIAVSTEVEWIWTEASEAWIDYSLDLPAIMNVEEMFFFLDRLNENQL